MKKLVLYICILVVIFSAASAYALPEISPTPSAASDELIKNGSTGERVARIQIRLRELGYFNFKPTGNFQNVSVQAAIRFQQMQVDELGQPIIADGTIGAQSMAILFSSTAKRADITASIPFGPQLTGTASVVGTPVTWDEIKPLLVQNKQYSFTDFNTGSVFSMTLTSVGEHAEMECSTAADTAMFLTCFGGAFNYSKRPMVMQLDGRMVAASMQGEPHGDDAVAGNDMDGHVCVYFSGCTSHVGSLPDVEHLTQIRKAAGQ